MNAGFLSKADSAPIMLQTDRIARIIAASHTNH